MTKVRLELVQKVPSLRHRLVVFIQSSHGLMR